MEYYHISSVFSHNTLVFKHQGRHIEALCTAKELGEILYGIQHGKEQVVVGTECGESYNKCNVVIALTGDEITGIIHSGPFE